MSLLKIFKAIGKKNSKREIEEFLKLLERKEKAIKKVLKTDLKKSVANELKDDLKSIKKLKEKIKENK